MGERLSLYERIVRPMHKQGMNEFGRLGEERAVAVGRELARRARLRPDRHPRLPATLAEVALTGSDEERRKAARELVRWQIRATGVEGGQETSGLLAWLSPSEGELTGFLIRSAPS